MSTSDDQLNAAIAAAIERLDAKPKNGLATVAGYGTAASGAAAWILTQSTDWNLPPVVQAILVGGAILIAASTGLGRQLQRVGKTKATGQVLAAAVAPVPVPPALVLSGSAGPMTVSPAPGGLPTPDEVLA